MNLELLTKQVSNLSRAVGRYIKNEYRNITPGHIETKGKNSFVTYVDRNAESRLVKELGKLLPGAGFIAEESDKYPRGNEYNWCIDPLDGTTNYIHGIPLFSISIALLRKDRVVSSVIFEANHQECFYTWEAGKAFLNGHEIHVSGAGTLEQSLLATGFPYQDYDKMDEYIHLFKEFMKRTRGLRRMGSAAVDLAYVACGRFDGFYEYGLNSWDVAAGSFLVEQAGGIVCDFSGAKNYIYGKEIIASNPLIFEEFKKSVIHSFQK
ncbi:MAG: inositol monophosphatase [Bacteroidales bacterium]|nr:inositol monophosphatase [Bacteroidales bacterium]